MENIRFDDVEKLRSKISKDFGAWSKPIEVTQQNLITQTTIETTPSTPTSVPVEPTTPAIKPEQIVTPTASEPEPINPSPATSEPVVETPPVVTVPNETVEQVGPTIE